MLRISPTAPTLSFHGTAPVAAHAPSMLPPRPAAGHFVASSPEEVQALLRTTDAGPIQSLLINYMHEIFDVPGVISVSWDAASTTDLDFNFCTEAERHTGEALLAPVIGGVNIHTTQALWVGGSTE